MKFRCPYCKHIIGTDPVAICPKCNKGIKVPEHLKESVDKIKEEQEKEEAAHAPKGTISFSSDILSLSSPVVPITVVMLAAVAIIYSKWSKSPYKYSSIEFNDPKTMIEKAANVSLEMAKKELWVLRMALEMFKRDCGRYPTTSEGIKALINNPGELTWKGPYVTFTRPDPWKHPYQYNATSNDMLIFSCGPDLTPSTADDVFPSEPTDKDRTDYDLPIPLLPTNTLTDPPPATP